jgi:hypothetical protein
MRKLACLQMLRGEMRQLRVGLEVIAVMLSCSVANHVFF